MTFLEIRQRIAELMGLSSIDDTADDNATLEDKFKEWVNTRYRVLCGKRPWNWLITDSFIQTVEQITTGTVNVSNGSASITFSSAPSISVTGWFIQFEDTDNWYEISAHTASATSATLTTQFIGTTDTTATYVLRKVYYALPSNTGQVLDMRETVQDRKIEYVPLRHLDRYVSDRTMLGTPNFYTIVGLDSSRLFRVEFFPVPDDTLQIWVRYYKTATELSSDSDVPVIPEAFHDILVWDVLATYGYLFLDDTRMSQAKSIRDAIYKDMTANDVDAENITQRMPFDVDLTESDDWLRRLDLPIAP